MTARGLALITFLILAGCRGDETASAYGAADKIWTLGELNGAAFTATATLVFPEPGRIAGEGPCNAYNASMTVPYPWFSAGTIAATRRACPDLEAESLFFSVLAEMTLIEVLGDTLILSTDDGRSMVFNTGD